MSLWEILKSDPDRLRAAVFYVLPVLVTILLTFAIKAWRLNEEGKRNAALKMEMLSKGMSADEIVNVLNAKSVPSRLAETMPYVKKTS